MKRESTSPTARTEKPKANVTSRQKAVMIRVGLTVGAAVFRTSIAQCYSGNFREDPRFCEQFVKIIRVQHITGSFYVLFTFQKQPSFFSRHILSM